MTSAFYRDPRALLLLGFVLLGIVVRGLLAQGVGTEEGGFSVIPKAFQPLAPDTGWLLLEGQLYWTDDAGLTWQVRTPEGGGEARILAANFLNPREGWVVTAGLSRRGSPEVRVARTGDGGRSWQWFAPVLSGEPGAMVPPAGAHLQFLDSRYGWLVLRDQSSSNFNTGALFSTADGGASWHKRAAVSGSAVHFISPARGWMLAGAADQAIFQSQNGGKSWQALHLPGIGGADRAQFYLPSFSPTGQGTLPVLLAAPGGTILRYYHSHDQGRTWYRGDETLFQVEFGQALPLAQAPDKILVSIPDDTVRRHSDRSYAFDPQSVNAPQFQALALHSPGYGWGLRVQGDCAAGGCRQQIQLLQTKDGGLTWSAMAVPEQYLSGQAGDAAQAPDHFPETSSSRPLSDAIGNDRQGTYPMTGQGFDKCEIPSTDQLKDWRSSSPYSAVNLYIGGSCRSCANNVLSSAFLTEVESQGWQFIPTWVGPQSSCYSGCSDSKISNDVAAAFQQGIQEADAALARAIELGLAAPDGSGAVIYYDLEAYSSLSTACRDAAESFVAGWSQRLREKGSVAGLYGATCGSLLSDFATIDHPPDAVWAAYWTYASYASEASVWDLGCLDNALWPDKQRIRQYAGGHIETWGGVSLSLDSNVLDGIVDSQRAKATPSPTASATVQASPTTPVTATPAATATPVGEPRCERIVLNGGFEEEGGWTINATNYPAAYSGSEAHSGQRSMRAGIVDAPDDVYSYSSVTQTITMPTGVADKTLNFWLYTQSAETGAVHLPQELLYPAAAAETSTSDRQMVLIQDSSGQIVERLLADRLNEQSWRAYSFDLSAYAGQTITLYFGVYNDGSDGATGMFLDDVSIGSCQEAVPTATATAPLVLTGTPGTTPTATTQPDATATAVQSPPATVPATPVVDRPYRFYLPTMFNDLSLDQTR